MKGLILLQTKYWIFTKLLDADKMVTVNNRGLFPLRDKGMIMALLIWSKEMPVFALLCLNYVVSCFKVPLRVPFFILIKSYWYKLKKPLDNGTRS